ncbi:MAG: hypothetical protein QE495_04565 [Acidovorax sp.]|uniref:AbiU2 domain-containing protein n=1 Tax=Acidovorax sp. TaxID=1872122 RepID=UPI002636EB9F|nr:hypothetical protein [Acidovorax sp.]MDH4425700.1 hypothetical protein [Acidovorax sp.]
MPTRIEKLQAHAGHLLDAFIQLRERYALLEPMLFNQDVASARGSGSQARGFRILKNSLFLSCAQDIAKLLTDRYETTPSIGNLIRALADDALRAELKDQFAQRRTGYVETENDPEILEVLRQWELLEEVGRREQFDALHLEATQLWARLSTSPLVNGFRTIRDTVTAHTEVRFVADKYQLVDVSALGIKWGDLRVVIKDMQRLVELLGQLIRTAGFAWEVLDAQLEKASSGFWGQPRA